MSPPTNDALLLASRCAQFGKLNCSIVFKLITHTNANLCLVRLSWVRGQQWQPRLPPYYSWWCCRNWNVESASKKVTSLTYSPLKDINNDDTYWKIHLRIEFATSLMIMLMNKNFLKDCLNAIWTSQKRNTEPFIAF